jgi:hypothetical protein
MLHNHLLLPDVRLFFHVFAVQLLVVLDALFVVIAQPLKKLGTRTAQRKQKRNEFKLEYCNRN